MERRILCFGDSNTWGYNSEKGDRFTSGQRWPGLLQNALEKQNANWKVIEEGRNGRTTVFGQNTAISCITDCIQSHKPLAGIIIMLGTNDTKTHFHASAQEIAQGMEAVLRQIQQIYTDTNCPPILLISPKPLNSDISTSEFDSESAARSAALAALYQQTAQKFGCDFLDLGMIIPGRCYDGIHLSEEQHRIAAEPIIEWVLSVLK